jgi:hypothetical protein
MHDVPREVFRVIHFLNFTRGDTTTTRTALLTGASPFFYHSVHGLPVFPLFNIDTLSPRQRRSGLTASNIG